MNPHPQKPIETITQIHEKQQQKTKTKRGRDPTAGSYPEKQTEEGEASVPVNCVGRRRRKWERERRKAGRCLVKRRGLSL